MNRKVFILLLLFTFGILASCNQSTPEVDMIEPGEKIGDMIVNTAPKDEKIEGWLMRYCDMEIQGEAPVIIETECEVPPLPYIFINAGMGGDYESTWPETSWEIYIDNQKINLEAFGTIDIQELRNWNVILENPTPGIHTLHTILTFDDDASNSYELIVTFTVAEQEKTYPILSSVITKGLNSFTSEKAGLDFLLYVPASYGTDTQRQWPLILYLHGGDKVNSTVDSLRNDYPLSALERQEYYPFIFVAPQGTGEYEFWATDEMVDSILTLLDEIQALLSINPNQVYLTGVSAGGNGSWDIGLRHPERFAALAPVMGYYGWPFSVPENICDLVDVPVWAFHGEKDETIPLEAEQKLIDALEVCGGDVQLTIFPNVGHDINFEKVYTSELYAWFLEQEK